MRIRTLSHDLQRVLPGALRVNRGKLNLQGVVEEALTLGADRLIFLERWKGAPGKVELYTLKPSVQRSFPIIYLSSVKLQEELNGRGSVKGRLLAILPEDADPELKRFGEALAGFLRILLETKLEAKGASGALVLGRTSESRVSMTFERLSDGAEIGPRLIVKNLVWTERRHT